jgi:hypothetical protein
MNYSTIKYQAGFKDLAAAGSYDLFTGLWREKKYEEALKHFPKLWHWIGIETGKETAGDIIFSIPAGIVLSEKAFSIIHKEFSEESKFHSSFNIDGVSYYWFQPPVIADGDKHNLHLLIVKGIYRTLVSDKFIKLWNSHGFTGADFIEIAQP